MRHPNKATVLALVGVLTAMANAAQGQSSSDPVVQTTSGAVLGTETDGVQSFKGVPFAAPPVGALRWRAPQPVVPWKGVRPATRYADDCMQEPFPGDAAPLGAPLSEDCLYLNIWKPREAKASRRLPVVVWIHGGGFVNGGASPATFQGDAFARKGVIMVGIAYRVGRFGFFAHPALTAENNDQDLLGNYGLMDEIAALRWVQRNIAAFGGDPANVTIFGESAGGTSARMLMASPLARGLFAKAIIQSSGGGPNNPGLRLLSRDGPGGPSLESLGVAFARQNGIEGNDAAALAKLRALPAEKVTAGLNMMTSGRQAAIYGGPAIDGRLIVAEPDAIFRAGRQTKVPVIIGATNADLSRLMGFSKAQAFARFGDRAEALRAHYDPDGTGSDQKVVSALGGDVAIVEPVRDMARTLSSQGVPVWAYRFSYVADSMRQAWPDGAPHASDVPYAMATVRVKYGDAATPRDIAVGEAMNDLWTNFARTGDPNGKGLPAWPRYQAAADVILDFAATGRPVAVPDPRRARLDAIAGAD